MPPPLEVTIERIGADGDGIATMPDGAPLYVPFTMADERVRARPVARRGQGWAAEADAVLEPGPERATPPCRHFGACGGCALQHWSVAAYQRWKTDQLAAALTRAGFPDPAIAPLVGGAPGQRRRLDLAVRRAGRSLLLGLHRSRSAEVIDLLECPVADPALVALIPPLRLLLVQLQAVRREASVVLNLLDSGPDMLLRTDAALSLADRTALTAFARAHGLPRIAWASGTQAAEPVCVLRPPTTALAGVPVQPPPGAFLQATRTGEAAIVDAVLAAMPRVGRIAELYAGCGTISFALARTAPVAAWEGDAEAVAALRQAVNGTGLAGRITATQRDLARQPLRAKELAGFAALVLDPPYAGAKPQMAAIAESRVPVVAYVSCNPAALARDAAVLAAAGYGLDRATPVDQFLWSARLESVCVFRRKAR